MSTDSLVTPKELLLRHSWLKYGTLRRYLLNRELNGLTEYGAIVQMSARQLLIVESAFLEWVLSHR
jgi:hypothetical protein